MGADALIPITTLEAIGLFLITGGLLFQYAYKKTHYMYLTSVFTAWYFGFFGTIFIASDLARSYAVEPIASSERGWRAIYWITFLLSWVALPLQMEFFASGYSRWKRRCIDSLKANLKFYILCGIAIAIVVVIVLTTSDRKISELPSIALSVANLYGLVLILLLLGYGLIEVPRKLWRSADPVTEMHRIQYYAVEVDAECFDAKCDLRDAMQEAKSTADRITTAMEEENYIAQSIYSLYNECEHLLHGRTDDTNRSGNSPRKNESKGWSLGSSGLQGKAKHRRGSSSDVPTTEELASVHARLKAAKALYIKASWRWRSLVEKSMYYDLIMTERGSAGESTEAAEDEEALAVVDQKGMEHILLESDSSNWFWRMWQRFVVWWHFKFSSTWYRMAAVASAILSALVLWGEVSIPLNNALGANISVLGLVVDAAKDVIGKHFLALIPLIYICVCVYFSLFRINLFGTVELASRHHTDAYSLMFNACYACRLQFSVAFNFLNLLSIPYDTSFSRSVGSDMALSQVDNYLPLVLLILCAATAFNAFEKLLRMLRIDQMEPPNIKNPEHQKQMKDGRAFIKKARRTFGLQTSALRLGFFGLRLASVENETEDSDDASSITDGEGLASAAAGGQSSSVLRGDNYQPPQIDLGGDANRNPFD
eukprot:gb/GECG01014886.1/.p1 GENE.gb/GECG01014886.1/~~gb/GECG01014886.1/.p1  ORF type:complete len:654 (+),score=59.87 gb/GECG01014886.1/:1-1962(+)